MYMFLSLFVQLEFHADRSSLFSHVTKVSEFYLLTKYKEFLSVIYAHSPSPSHFVIIFIFLYVL